MKLKLPVNLPSLNRLPFPYRAAPVPHSVEPLPPKRTTGIDYDTEWARRFGVRMARVMLLDGIVTPAVYALATPERRGLDRLEDLKQVERDDGSVAPVIFAANHHSHVDTPLLLASLPEPWRPRSSTKAGAS